MTDQPKDSLDTSFDPVEGASFDPQNNASVSAQVTDSVTQNNVSVVGHAPAHALGVLYQTTCSAAGMAMLNAVNSQNTLNQLGPAIVANAIAVINASGPSTAVDTIGERSANSG